MTKNIAILISDKGTGTNLQAIIDLCEKDEIKGQICVVVSNTSNALGLERAKKHKIPAEVFGWSHYKEAGKGRNEYTKDLAGLLKDKYNPDLVVLAGWILILTKEFFEIFPNVLNIHPGLIPDKAGSKVYFPDGREAPTNEEIHTDDAISAFLEGGYQYAGSTIHFVTPSVDWGPVVFRDFEKIEKDDTVDTLYTRLKKKEHAILIKTVSLFCQGKLSLEDSSVKVLK
ncbi:MAG: formyltransferase family protein [Candidatus Woykebacteria bacterium]